MKLRLQVLVTIFVVISNINFRPWNVFESLVNKAGETKMTKSS